MRVQTRVSADRPPGKFTVLMTTEGTYPFHGGGVSTWCDVLLQNLPDIDFKLMAVMMNPFLRQRYDLPDNVVELIGTPLWGVEEPKEYSLNIPFSQVHEAKRATTTEVINTQFLPLFRSFVRQVQRNGDPTLLGMLLYGMHHYFAQYDYNVTFRSGDVWRVFREELILAVQEEIGAYQQRRIELDIDEEDDDPLRSTMPSILETTDCLRFLYRFMTILSHPVPRADVAHSAAAAFCGIPCIIAKQAYGIPFLLTEHGVYLREQYLSIARGEYTYHSKRFLMMLISSIVYCCYRFADIVAPVCRWNTRWEKRHGVPADRIRVIYNGVDPDRFVPLPNIERDPRPTVVTMALIFPLKDIATLIHAADITRKAIPDVQFQVFGAASDQEYYQSCLRLRERMQMEATFHFMGRTARPEQAYNLGDVIALSSLSEAFPFSVVEAMMCGKPIVATDVGGVSEALGDTGIVVRARNPAALADGIINLLNDPRRRADMGEDARNRALSFFTTAHFIEQYREVYQDLLENRTRQVRDHAA